MNEELYYDTPRGEKMIAPYDKDSLNKVYFALQRAGLKISQAHMAITEMQKAGIIFMEKLPENNLPDLHWSKDGLHCSHCGADSNLSHIPSCPNYGLYDDNGDPIPAIPYVKAQLKVSKEDLEDTADLYAQLLERRRPMTNPEASPILRYFNYRHLPEPLQDVSKMFCILAEDLENLLPPGPEKSVALRKLLEAKDAAVRSRLS